MESKASFSCWAQSGFGHTKSVYCLLILVATSGFITTDEELDAVTALGTGVMLFANIPIILIFSRQTMANYHDYVGRLHSGQMQPKAKFK